MRKKRALVVGGGSAGLACAAGLVSKCDVTVVEAGWDPGEPGPERFRTVPLPVGDDVDWGYREARLGHPILAGRVLGGTSSINLCCALRPSPKSFESWPAGWGWEDVLPEFCAVEKDLDFGEAGYHGHAGPIPIKRPTLAPLDSAFVQCCQDLGFPWVEDLNSPGAWGVGAWPTNWNDRRAGTLATLAPGLRSEARLLCNTSAVRLVEEGGRVVGALVADESGERVIRAEHTVVACGALGSPRLLQRSGLGGSDVGRHLQNHPGVVIGLEGEAATSELNLPGVCGLSVADASVMPTLVDANPNLTTIMIGHRAARMLRFFQSE